MPNWKLAIGAALAVLAVLPRPAPAAAPAADRVYVNAAVITLDRQGGVKQALAVKDGRVLAAGTDAEVRALAGEGTRVDDLGGKAVVPGFYAAHDHFPSGGTAALFGVNLNSPPIGPIEDIDALVEALRQRAKEVPKGRWVTGRGYDDTLLKEGRHPTRYDLDRVSADHPVFITHTSGHLAVANSRALQMAKITRDTPQPGGGRIRKDPKTGEPDGVLEETTSLVGRLIPGRSREDVLRGTEHAVAEYASRGVTTAVVASGGQPSIANLKRAVAQGILKLRVVTMTSGGPAEASRELVKKLNSDKLKVGAIKLMQDGSIQGFTGYLSRPYHTPFQENASYRGYSLRSRASLTKQVKELHKAGYQIAVHGNGDAAIDDILFAFGEAQKEHPRPDARHRIEHCQTAREDQLDVMAALGVTPSYFAGHVFYWGDRHEAIFLGPERAARISPLASTARRSIRFTVHDDTPVTPVNPLQLVWVGATRITRNGRVLGADQKVSAEAALRAVTADAAWQNFEEATKGTLEPGKLADLVVLDQNPLAVEPAKIRDIRVLETVVGGQTIYKR